MGAPFLVVTPFVAVLQGNQQSKPHFRGTRQDKSPSRAPVLGAFATGSMDPALGGVPHLASGVGERHGH